MPAAHWFCPEHDIVLGRNATSFTPPRQAALLARCGAPLLWWMAAADDVILLPADLSDLERYALGQWRDIIAQAYGQGAGFADSLHSLPHLTALRPWGISHYSASCLARRGAPSPLTSGLNICADAVRELSHRRSSIFINRALTSYRCFSDMGMPAPIIPIEAKNIEEARQAIDTFGEVFVKTPWSSSGRGVLHGSANNPAQLLRRCESAITSQGSVLIEKAHRKVLDFAMLFEAEGHDVRQIGLSLFFNAREGAYGGNLLAPDSEIAAHVGKLLPSGTLPAVSAAMCRILSQLLQERYHGPLGVDMMVAEDECGQTYLVPCVELNLRCTMGFVARGVYKKTAGSYNLMQIVPGGIRPTNAGMLKGALIDLVPPNPYFRIIARNVESSDRPHAELV